MPPGPPFSEGHPGPGRREPICVLALPLPGLTPARPACPSRNEASLRLAPLRRKRLVRPRASRCRPHTVLRKYQEKRPQEGGFNCPKHSQGLYLNPAATARRRRGRACPRCPPRHPLSETAIAAGTDPRSTSWPQPPGHTFPRCASAARLLCLDLKATT